MTADWRANSEIEGRSSCLGGGIGLVGSAIAGEGSRTGFYTDEYRDQTFKEPEAIRKANLCGADLIHCDFYLVDLRHALYDQEQGEHFRRCGAIL